ncbi:MAG TPA: Rho termination factor N-terminal domain-containing protein, partial [Nakamurella sp.]
MSNTDLLSSDSAKAVSTAASSDSDSQGGASANGTAPRKRAGLSGMVLAELRELAGQLGLSGTAGMRKGDLIAAIKERQAGGSARTNGRSAPVKGGQTELPVTTASAPPAAEPAARTQGRDTRSRDEHETRDSTRETTRDGGTRDGDDGGFSRNRRRRTASRPAGSPDGGGHVPANGRDTDDAPPARDDAQAQGDRRDQGRDQG